MWWFSDSVLTGRVVGMRRYSMSSTRQLRYSPDLIWILCLIWLSPDVCWDVREELPIEQFQLPTSSLAKWVSFFSTKWSLVGAWWTYDGWVSCEFLTVLFWAVHLTCLIKCVYEKEKHNSCYGFYCSWFLQVLWLYATSVVCFCCNSHCLLVMGLTLKWNWW